MGKYNYLRKVAFFVVLGSFISTISIFAQKTVQSETQDKAQSETQSAVQGKWNLERCIRYAEEHNVDMKIAKLNIENKKLEENTAKWSRLPSLSAQVGQSWNWGRTQTAVKKGDSGEYSTVYVDASSNSSRTSISTSLPIFNGFSINNNYDLAKLNLQATMADYDQALQNLGIQVTSAYLQVVFNLEMMNIAIGDLDISIAQENRIAELVHLGKLPQVDLADAKSRTAQGNLRLVEAENSYHTSLLNLCQLIELPYSETMEVEKPMDEVNKTVLGLPDDIYREAILNRGDIRAASLRVKGGEKNINIARSAFMPQISLNAGLGTNYYSTINRSFHDQLRDNYSKYIGVSVNIPIFNRMQTSNRYRSAKIQYQQLNLQFEKAKKQVHKDIDRAYRDALNAKEKYEASMLAEAANAESFELMQKKYEYGKANSVEFEEVKNKLLGSRASLLQAKYDYLFKVKLLKMLASSPL